MHAHARACVRACVCARLRAGMRACVRGVSAYLDKSLYRQARVLEDLLIPAHNVGPEQQEDRAAYQSRHVSHKLVRYNWYAMTIDQCWAV